MPESPLLPIKMTSHPLSPIALEVSVAHAMKEVSRLRTSDPSDRNGAETAKALPRKVLPKSPISVIHMLSLEPLPLPPKMASFEPPTKRALMDHDGDCCSQTSHSTLPPPLEQVTVCSSIAGDNDDDLSCLSSDDDLCSSSLQSHPRSIFQNFWSNAGALPTPIRSRQVLQDDEFDHTELLGGQSPSTADGRRLTSDIYERALQAHEQGPKLRRSERRRSIFNGVDHEPQGLRKSSCSTPELQHQQRQRLGRPIRKTQSSSTFRSGSSILRSSCRYSSCSTITSNNTFVNHDHHCSSSERSVSFSPNVNVAVFEKPAERYAEEGWSSWFH